MTKKQEHKKLDMFSKRLENAKSKLTQIDIESILLPKSVLKNSLISYVINVITNKHSDLPLDKSEDTRFVIILIALMTFLGVLALSGTFALHSLTNKWSSGLENKITIEIATQSKDGHILSQETILKETKTLYEALSTHSLVKSINVLGDTEIQELVSPWIGDNLNLGGIPLPGLIAIELRKSDAKDLSSLRKDIEKISKHANLETHHEWLSDLINFTDTLRTLALIISIIVGTITIIAITIAVRTRLSIHHNEVELLHHMGATDNYIAKQFQRHALILSLKGALIGTALGVMVTYSLTLLSRNSGTDLIPVLQVGFFGFFIILLVPFFISLITILTSHVTVLRSLAKMP